MEPRQDVVDVGMVAESNRHEPNTMGVRPGRFGDLQDAGG
jgi:hypothetical protein